VSIGFSGEPDEVPVCSKVMAVAFQSSSDLLPVGLPSSPASQRAHPDLSVWVGLGPEQQADRAYLLQFVGEQPEAAWVEKRGRDRDWRDYSEMGPHAVQQGVQRVCDGLSRARPVRCEGRTEIRA
jgi:hypothetical protein